MAKLEVEILGDSRSLEKAFDRSSKSAKGFNNDISKQGKKTGSLFSGITKGIGLATGAIGVAGFAGAVHAAFGEMEDSQKVAAQTAAVLKSTGGAANVSAKQVDELANSLLKKTGYDDEVIKSGENLLLTFTNVRNEVGKGNDIFNQATKTVLDMSTALGQDTKQSAIQLGKALNDPIKGVGALRRVGVQLSDAQVDLVKHLVHTGDTLGAQKVILGELRKEFGGSAVAAGKTLPGQLNILKETLTNLGGEIAQKLSPTIIALVQRMTKWLNNTKNQKTIMDTLNTIVGVVTTSLKILKGAFDVLSKAVGGNKHAIELLVAAYATWKIAGLIGNVTTLAGRFGLLAGSTNKATVATRGMSGALGKAGLAGAALAAGFAIGQLLNKIPAVQRAEAAIGGFGLSVTDKLGITHDPNAQFSGKQVATGAQAKQLIGEARRLERGGLTARQAAARLAAAHPGFAERDLSVFAEAARRPAGGGGVVVHGDLHVHGVQDPRKLQDAITKNSRGRPVRRRGDP